MITDKVHRSPEQGMIVRDFDRPRPEVIEIFRQAYSGFILDHLGKVGHLRGILPLAHGMKLCGTAVTCLGSDLSIRRMAIDMAKPGDILMVANNGITDYSCFGDGTAYKMRLKQMEGCVIDGATRDSGRLIDMNFPTFAKGVTPRNYHYPVSAEHCAINVDVVMGGVKVSPGDIIFGDDDGVIVIPKTIAAELAPLVAKNLAEEKEARAKMTQYTPFGLEEELRKRNYTFL